jgi:hypothetical protein
MYLLTSWAWLRYPGRMKETLISIARELINIEKSDLTVAEKRICDKLVAAGILKAKGRVFVLVGAK